MIDSSPTGGNEWINKNDEKHKTRNSMSIVNGFCDKHLSKCHSQTLLITETYYVSLFGFWIF